MQTRSTRLARAAILLASLSCASTALANGRFPRSQRLLESPTDPNRLTLAATYGLLTTSDRGKNWYHVCEAAFSFDEMYTGDPVVDLTADESLLAGVQGALTISHDHGCQWASVLQAPNQAIIDFSISRSNRNDAIVLVTIYGDGGAPVHRLQESTNGGMTWNLVGAPLPAAVVYTVDIDPKDPAHIVASGANGLTETSTGLFLSSSDHGAHWTSTMIPGTNGDRVSYIAAIHPTEPQKIFVRTDAWKDRTNIDTALVGWRKDVEGNLASRSRRHARRQAIRIRALTRWIDGTGRLRDTGRERAAHRRIVDGCLQEFGSGLHVRGQDVRRSDQLSYLDHDRRLCLRALPAGG